MRCRCGGGCNHGGSGCRGAMPRRAPPAAVPCHGLATRGSRTGTLAVLTGCRSLSTAVTREPCGQSCCRQRKRGMQIMLEGSVMHLPPTAAATCICGPPPVPRWDCCHVHTCDVASESDAVRVDAIMSGLEVQGGRLRSGLLACTALEAPELTVSDSPSHPAESKAANGATLNLLPLGSTFEMEAF